MTFINPWALLALVAVPVLAIAYGLVQLRRGRRRPDGFELADTSGTSVGGRRHVPAAVYLAAATLLIFSLARPEMNLSLPTFTGRLILVFDTSNSMVADDVEPTRLDVAKQTAQRFVDRQPSSVQVGVVAFTNGGLVVQQPTTSKVDVRDAIDRLSTDGGTSIGEGILAGLTAIADDPISIDPTAASDVAGIDIGFYSNAAIVVFTDGEDIGGADPLELAGLAANAGVPVYTVGVGTPRGTIVPLDGFSIATALDEAMLEAIAESTDGAFYLAADDPELGEIFEAIDRRWERQGERIEITAIIAMLGIGLIIVAGALNMRWFGRVV